MKKFLLFITAFIFVCSSTLSVLAAVEGIDYSDVEPAEEDDLGRYTSGGYVHAVYHYTNGGDLREFIYSNITSNGEPLYILHNSASSNGWYQVQNVSSAFYVYNTDSTSKETFVYESTITLNFILSTQWDLFVSNLPIFDSDDTDGIAAYLESGDYSSAENADDIDYIEAYNDDSISQPTLTCTNAGDFSLTDSGKLTIGNIKVGWPTEDDDSKYDVCIRAYLYFYNTSLSVDWSALLSGGSATVGDVVISASSSSTAGIFAAVCKGVCSAVSAFGSSTSLVSSGWGGWTSAGTMVSNSSVSTIYTCSVDTVTEYINGCLSSMTDCSDYFFSRFEVRVRHRVGSACSKWSVCTIKYDSDDEDGAEVTYSTRDDNDVEYDTSDAGDSNSSDSSSDTNVNVSVDGSGSGGDITINIDNSNDNQNTNTNNNTNTNSNESVVDTVNSSGEADGSSIDWSFTDLLSFLKSGFGLLGDSGFISMLSLLLPFLPAEFFTILTIGVTVVVILCIVNLIKRLFS